MKQKHPNPVIGQKFGKWTVKEEKIGKKYNRYYFCECDCGEKSWISKTDLITSKSTKCRKCYSIETSERLLKDLTGQKINNWTVIKRTGVAKNSRTPLWLCRCDCGKEAEVRASNLHSKKSKCCGRCDTYGDICVTKWSAITRQAKERNIDFNLTIEDAWDLYIKQNKKCALTDVDIVLRTKKSTASLDRIDSFKGYSKENCQWVHKTVNCTKGKLSNNQFVSLCYEVCAKHKNENYDWKDVNLRHSNKNKKGTTNG